MKIIFLKKQKPFIALRDLILAGNISEAILLCNSKFPGLLAIDGAYQEIFFMLKTQHFIELIRSSVPKTELIHFAQTELAPFGFYGDVILEQLQVFFSSYFTFFLSFFLFFFFFQLIDLFLFIFFPIMIYLFLFRILLL